MTVAAFTSHAIPRRSGLLTRLKAATGRHALDRRLARGAEPEASPELACRARVLGGWRVRHSFADALERVVREAEHPDDRFTAAIPVARDEVLAARDDLLRAARALRAEPRSNARGIAEVSLLLTDGAGPLFAAHPPGTLREVAFRAAFHLEAG
jgi:hypothetical protein